MLLLTTIRKRPLVNPLMAGISQHPKLPYLGWEPRSDSQAHQPITWACPYTGLPVAVVHLFSFPWADRQLGMFISPVPWLSSVQEREERGFGLALGGDRRQSRLSHKLIALLTLSAVYKLPPTKDSCLWLAPLSQGRLT